MKNREDIQFKKWKKDHKLNEGFLDGEEEKPVTADDTTGQEETKEENNEEVDASVEEPSDDIDISEEPSEDTDGEEEQPESQTVIELRGDRTQLGVQQVVQPYDECPNAEGDGPWRKQTAPVATYDLFL
jgi:hypothetical protein